LNKENLPSLNSFTANNTSWLESTKIEGLKICKEVISIEEESALIRMIAESPNIKFVSLRNRRVANIGGIVDSETGFLPTEEFSFDELSWLKNLKLLIESLVEPEMEGHATNHLLLNHYRAGDGIMPHKDGPRYFPVVNILSLGSDCVMEFTKKEIDGKEVKVKAFVPARSLLQFSIEAYTDYLHGIQFVTEDLIEPAKVEFADEKDFGVKYRQERYSLTFRYVP
jgi:alkylated DNA repair protein alkB homolog 6